MKKSLIVGIIVALSVISACASLTNPWMVNKESNSRFIPVELWSGSPWNGEKNLVMTPANTIFGSRNHKRIAGPIQWRHPVTGETMQVYERINETKKGVKRQLYTINPDGSGVAKVYDERPNSATRVFSTNAVMFPIGQWRRGEKRQFNFEEYIDGRAVKRKVTIHIRRLSYTYKKVDYAIKFDFLVHDDEDKIVFHERFIYGPEKSLMYYKSRL